MALKSRFGSREGTRPVGVWIQSTDDSDPGCETRGANKIVAHLPSMLRADYALGRVRGGVLLQRHLTPGAPPGAEGVPQCLLWIEALPLLQFLLYPQVVPDLWHRQA